MIESYMQNAEVGMTKETYFEMCEALGSEPVAEEIPVEIVDFPVEMQEVLEIYRMLRDNWDTMNGNYLGKHFIGISDLFDIAEIDFVDRKLYLTLLHIVDNIRAQGILKLKPKQQQNPLP